MRVAFVAEVTAQHEETGATRRLRRTAELLASRGHEITVFCAQWWDGNHESFEQESVTYHAVTTEPPGETPSRRFGLSLPGALRRAKPDVIHATAVPKHVLAAKTASKFARAPLVVDWYEAPPAGTGTASKSLRMAARAPDEVITPSETVKTRVRGLGANSDDVRVVPNSIDMDAIREAQVVDGADIVYSRRLDEDANLESLLLALAELRDKGWHAVVIGDGPARRQYERQTADLRIDDRIEFTGAQPAEKRIPVFRGANVYVQTARKEAFPTDLLRALACGCAGVVEYHVESSAHELVEREERTFRTTSEQELTDALREAATLPEMTENDAFEKYDHRPVLEQYLDCYRDVQDSFGFF
ncbi:Glycosyltransferase involved in cell wall bisynthesis [Haladaptatus litoreus]|uniref:Glycosyltransferase involved in cell wall bisynthesis n=1 Tax=Haladaptatus litoreus TaxID=553468 RepID=A0A1N6VR70_9EURY|nr:glycosyltransferase family 4 protein [Haladaptatus litoreus]SIQ80294.1 Glycosyltransferase involved in cell wall bisynthesis [Haladaptatus litoreus]